VLILEDKRLSVEMDLVICILKLTVKKSVVHEEIKNEVKMPSNLLSKLLRKLQNDGLIIVEGDAVKATSRQRLELAAKATQLGGDLEKISRLLSWKEFEDIAAEAFARNCYRVTKNLHFKHKSHRWEIDIVGCRKPFVICVDCKHWQRALSPSMLEKIVREQISRTKALAESLPNPAFKTDFSSWDKIKALPVVLTLVTGQFKFHHNVPVVSVLQLQDFLSQFFAYQASLLYFPVHVNHLA